MKCGGKSSAAVPMVFARSAIDRQRRNAITYITRHIAESNPVISSRSAMIAITASTSATTWSRPMTMRPKETSRSAMARHDLARSIRQMTLISHLRFAQ